MKFLTSSIRSLPNFIIIGSPKSGTTSLFNYLIQHPDIVGITRKEPHFFNISYSKNLNWYKMYFPTKSQLISNKITGEATPSYFIDPFVPKRIFSVLPDIKLILLLRNPIDRSFSHYKHSFKDGFENLSFENAIAAEEKRLENYENDLKIKSTNGNESFLEYVKKLSQYHPPNLYLFSYLKTSIYAEHLLNWLNVFQKKTDSNFEC